MSDPVIPAAPAAVIPAAPAAPATPAPAAPAAPAPAAPAPAPKGGVEAVTYEPTENPVIDMALSIIGGAGIPHDHPAMVAAEQGDFALLEAELAVRDPKGAAQAVALLKREFEAGVKKAEETEQLVGETILKQAASAEEWVEAVEWVKGVADEGEREVLNSLLSTPAGAKIAASYIVGMYRTVNQTDVAPAAATAEGAAVRPSAPAVTTLNRRQFADEAQKLHAKLGDGYRESAEYRNLAARLK